MASRETIWHKPVKAAGGRGDAFLKKDFAKVLQFNASCK
jgi:hypothetical protein